jgi:hypothetical protein
VGVEVRVAVSRRVEVNVALGVKVEVRVEVEVRVAVGVAVGSGDRRIGAVLVMAATAVAGGVGVDRGVNTAQAITVQPIMLNRIRSRFILTTPSL